MAIYCNQIRGVVLQTFLCMAQDMFVRAKFDPFKNLNTFQALLLKSKSVVQNILNMVM